MSIYQRFCKEVFDAQGKLKEFEIQCPSNFNFGYDVVDAIAAEEPEKTALVWCDGTGQEHIFSFDEIKRRSNQVANVFHKHGIGKGDAVMVMLKRHYEYWFVVLALHKLGAVMVPVTHMLTVDDVIHRVQSASIKGVVCAPTEWEKLWEAKEQCDTLSCLWTVRTAAKGFWNLSEELEEEAETLSRQDTKVSEPLAMYFTSGTTGYPKAVIHDHSYPLSHIITAKYWQQVVDGGLHFTVAETGWAKASWGKIYGQWLAGSAVMAFDFDNFEPKQLMSIINHYKVTTFCAPPTVYRYFVKKGMVDMPSLQHATTAGEALNPEVFRKFYEKTGIPLMEGFGQTESALILGNFAGTVSRPGAMGKPSPLYHVAILKDDGTWAEAGEIGELVILPPKSGRQLGIFVGYHENPALYEYVWRGGVYHTGDTAWYDEDGYFWFNGRIDDVIKTGGYRVGPFEIEHVLMEHPAVMECAVVGIPDVLRGQAIKAFVIPMPGTEVTAALQREVREFCNAKNAEYKWIRTVEFVKELPKTISGKIRKTELRVRS